MESKKVNVKRRKFDAGFKMEALKMLDSVRNIAVGIFYFIFFKVLGISKSAFYTWQRSENRPLKTERFEKKCLKNDKKSYF